MVRAKKSLGQNFLVDPNLQRKIVDAVDPRPDDEILEIGPGTGALTQHLAGRAGRLVAVELDDDLARRLASDFAGAANVEVLHMDALELDRERHLREPRTAKIVGNIPYNITTPLIFRLLERPRPASIVLMIQKEVADRILAPPGEKAYGALSVGVRTVALVERLFNVGRGAFRPVPDVDSAVIRIVPFDPPSLSGDEEADVRALTRTAFAWRRKQLQKILRAAPDYGLAAERVAALQGETGIDMSARPETLEPEAFVALARALRAHGLPAQHEGNGAAA